MLIRLDISNYALIENVSLDLSNGFTTITGETGAGKSILLKSLNLLLGERADTSVLKQNEKKCFLEAEFDVKNLGLEDFFQQNDLDYEAHCCIRREFNQSGKSRSFVNDSPVQLSVLKELGERLISIHSQHESLALFSPEFQMDLIDHFAGIDSEVRAYKKEYRQYRNKLSQLSELEMKDKESRKEKDYLEFLLNELEEADLRGNNLEELQRQNQHIENAEKIHEHVQFVQSVFENETYGPGVGVKTIVEQLNQLKELDPRQADIAGRMLSLKIELEDIASEVNELANGTEFSEEDVQIVKDKIEKFNALLYKHNLQEINELIELQKDLSDQVAGIQLVEQELETVRKDIEDFQKTLRQKAEKIAVARRKKVSELELLVSKKLSNLAMEDAELKVELTERESFGPNGLDDIQLLFKANLGGQFSPIKKVASGGELSRLMLTILSILSQSKNLPTLIFDEIDTGVSGEVAAKIADEFVQMGSNIQLISITHLPQVASKGTQHLHVSKAVHGEKTVTSVQLLDKEARIQELAKMISGTEITEAARENAINLLQSA